MAKNFDKLGSLSIQGSLYQAEKDAILLGTDVDGKLVDNSSVLDDKVDKTITVNSKPISTDIMLDADDVNALDNDDLVINAGANLNSYVSPRVISWYILDHSNILNTPGSAFDGTMRVYVNSATSAAGTAYDKITQVVYGDSVIHYRYRDYNGYWKPWKYTANTIDITDIENNKVDKTIEVNGQPLSANVNLDYDDVNALSDTTRVINTTEINKLVNVPSDTATELSNKQNVYPNDELTTLADTTTIQVTNNRRTPMSVIKSYLISAFNALYMSIGTRTITTTEVNKLANVPSDTNTELDGKQVVYPSTEALALEDGYTFQMTNNRRTTASVIKYYIQTAFNSIYVPLTRTINSKPLSSNVTLNASDIGTYSSSNLQKYTKLDYIDSSIRWFKIGHILLNTEPASQGAMLFFTIYGSGIGSGTKGKIECTVGYRNSTIYATKTETNVSSYSILPKYKINGNKCEIWLARGTYAQDNAYIIESFNSNIDNAWIVAESNTTTEPSNLVDFTYSVVKSNVAITNTNTAVLSTDSNGNIIPSTTTFVPTTRTINSKPLTSNVTLSAADVGAYATTYVDNLMMYKFVDKDTISTAGKWIELASVTLNVGTYVSYMAQLDITYNDSNRNLKNGTTTYSISIGCERGSSSTVMNSYHLNLKIAPASLFNITKVDENTLKLYIKGTTDNLRYEVRYITNRGTQGTLTIPSTFTTIASRSYLGNGIHSNYADYTFTKGTDVVNDFTVRYFHESGIAVITDNISITGNLIDGNRIGTCIDFPYNYKPILCIVPITVRPIGSEPNAFGSFIISTSGSTTDLSMYIYYRGPDTTELYSRGISFNTILT